MRRVVDMRRVIRYVDLFIMIHASYLRIPRHAIDMRPQTRGVSRRKQIYVYYDTPHIWYRYEHIYEYRDTPHIYTDTPHIYTDTPRADF